MKKAEADFTEETTHHYVDDNHWDVGNEVRAMWAKQTVNSGGLNEGYVLCVRPMLRYLRRYIFYLAM